MLRIQLQELLNMMELDEYHPASLMASNWPSAKKLSGTELKN